MKKKFALTLTAVVAAIALFALTACSLLFSFGADDCFPYEAAVSRGETGSHDSWLSSLDSPTTEYRRAYEEAKADGSFTGTYFEFLEALGISEGNGARVQSALCSVVSIFCRFNASRRGGDDYYSAGAGVIYALDTVEGDALIVTNYHVVYSADSNGRERVSHVSDDITLYLYGGEIASRAITATYLGGALEYDIAVLKVEDSPILKASENEVYAREVVAANSDAITVGERVYAIGNADGVGMSVVEGIVSVDAEYIDIYGADEETVIKLLEIRTDAAVNHGNSGGGLFDASGELIGIVNARDESEGLVGFGYAIPANLALACAQNIIDTCASDSRAHGGALARMGITAKVADSRAVFDRETGKLYIEEKVVLSDVDYRGKADNAGLKPDDTLISAKLTSSRGGVPYEREVYITRLHKLTNLLFEVRRGDTLEVTVSRGGELITVTLEYSDNSDFKTLQ